MSGKAEIILGFYHQKTAGLDREARGQKLFDMLLEELRRVEGADGKQGFVVGVNLGRLLGLYQSLDAMNAWPSPDYRERYRPRVIVAIVRFLS
jgi:hypothetical protein